jgi:stage V sporulation protein D (sporulation-specific penicillin-binding protein)
MRRFYFILWTVSFFYIAIISRLFFLQIISGEKYRVAASSQHSYELSIPAIRGSIQTSDGNPLAMSTVSYLIYAQPKILKDPENLAEKIAPLLKTDPQQLHERLIQSDLFWLPLAHKVDAASADTIRRMGVKGIGFEPESKRFYPEASMAAHVIGFVGSDQAGNDKGYFGLEGYYDRDLRGKNGSLKQEKDVHGNPIAIADIKRVPPENGRTLVLWMDRVVQHIAETRLVEGIRKYGALEGTVTIMDPKTGGILAMSAFPSYDPASYPNFKDTLYKNPIVSSGFEPGSTFKSLVMAAGLSEKVITPQTTMQETGPVNISQYLIRTWNDKYNGTVSMTDVLVHSSNVGMVFVGNKLGQKRLLRYIQDFGFGESTGIDLEEETSPEIRPIGDWKQIDYATATFGQGIAVTPLQMVRAVGALANGGRLMQPKIVKEIRDGDKVSTVPIKEIRRVISQSAAQIITEMMVAAVDRGEAKWAKPKGYRIAGKTGTAQIPVAGHYDAKKTIASFVGFAPADDPRFVVLVTLREPTTSPWGSETAAPLFFNIAKDLFRYYGIAPN